MFLPDKFSIAVKIMETIMRKENKVSNKATLNWKSHSKPAFLKVWS